MFSLDNDRINSIEILTIQGFFFFFFVEEPANKRTSQQGGKAWKNKWAELQ